jgi:hypothetical protein
VASKYKPAADKAWPEASKAFAGMMGTKLPAGIDPALFTPIAQAFVVTAIAEKVDAADCPVAEKVFATLEPLPPQNLASLMVTFIQEAGKDKDVKQAVKDKVGRNGPSFDICPSQPEL